MIGLLEACLRLSVKGTRVVLLVDGEPLMIVCVGCCEAVWALTRSSSAKHGSAQRVIFFAPLARKKMSIDNESDQVS